MQSAYDAMDELDASDRRATVVPVPDELEEFRRAVAAIVRPEAEPAPPNLAPGLSFPGASLLDLKGLARPEKFDGSDDRWLDWKEGFLSSMELLNLTGYLLAIDNMVEPIQMERLTVEEQTLSKLLHTILRSCLEGRARSIYKLVDRSNGFEAWRQLLLEYEPRENARYAAMMVGIMRPRWSGRLADFPKELRAWELAVARYQLATHAVVPEAVR